MEPKSARLFDSHAHLDDERFDGDREALIESLPDNGVGYVINAGADLESSRAGIDIAARWPHVYAAAGVHPHDAKELDESGIETLREMLQGPKVVAVGEIGLDYHYDYSPREKQRYWFERQLALAQEISKPVIIHSREATEDTLSVLKKYARYGVWGVVHAFSGSVETAEIVLNMGLMIGIGGTVTFKNAVKPVEVAGKVPMDRLLIETDCPYLTPAPHRGKRNEPAYVGYVAEKIAEIRGIPVEDVIRVTYDNACRLYGIDGENE